MLEADSEGDTCGAGPLIGVFYIILIIEHSGSPREHGR